MDEVTTKAESLQAELLESEKSDFQWMQKLNEYYIAKKQFQESLNKKTNQKEEQSKIDKFVKHLQVIRVEIDIQRAEAIQLFQAVDGRQY